MDAAFRRWTGRMQRRESARALPQEFRMAALTLAAILWIGVHVGIAGTSLRAMAVARLGEGGFRVAFSLASVVSIWLLVTGWNAAPTTILWSTPDWARWLVALLMLPAFVLLVASFRRNPTAAGGDALIGAEPTGIQRVTRHPMLWSFAIWAAVHVAGNGDSASLLFFGAFLVTALAGMPSIDAKLAKRRPEAWSSLAARTSVLPFAAIAQGRNRFVPAELRLPAILGLLAWAALLYLHPSLFGVPALAP